MSSTVKSYIQYLLQTLLIVCSFPLAAQPGLDTIVNRFSSYRSSTLQEKLYLHTDKDVYFAGESLWLKAYYIDGSFHKPLDVSKVAYVEVLDKANHPVLQGKIALAKGFGTGSFFITASIPSGHYTLRGYTNWMKNSGPEFYFQKEISIVNSFQKLEGQKAVQTTSFDAQFFPEGGHLINGLQNLVGFQVVNSSGSGLNCKGAILNEQNDTIVSFRPLKFGIGSFQFTPIAGVRYRAVVIDGKRQQLFNLPVPLNHDYVLHAEEDEENLNIIIRTNESLINNQAFLFIHSRQRVSVSRQFTLLLPITSISINKKELHEGISHITLFDSNSQPVCERLFFKKPEKNLTLQITENLPSYKVRNKVTLKISTKDWNGRPKISNLSISVAAKDSLFEKKERDILSYLWLTSDLKGSIESPEYYLSETRYREAIDNLMLTHGWRRFDWKVILDRKKSEASFIPEFRSHIIRGKVKDEAGVGVRGVETYMSSASKNIVLYVAKSDADGNVQYETKNFTGPRKIITQTNLRKDSLYRINLESPFSDKFAIRKLPPFYIAPSMESYVISRSIGMQVQDIYYKEENEKVISPAVDTVSFFGKPDETYLLDDYTRFPVMEEVMREYVSGVFVRKRRDGFHFLTLNRIKNDVLREDPMILLDGVPVFDVDKIMAYNPLQVKKIDLLTRKYYLGPMTFPGVVSYTTYNNDMPDFQLGPRAVVLDYEGLQLQREFYSPSYETPLKRQTRLPDRRNLLYWNPEIITDKNGITQIQFYTSDNPGIYKITIEGISGDGVAGRSSLEFLVER